LSARVTPASAPASIARNTERGSRRLARRRASATLSNQSRVPATVHSNHAPSPAPSSPS
jgi:hypothetical protein